MVKTIGTVARFDGERRDTRGDDDGHTTEHQISRQFPQPIGVIVRPAEFDRYIAALDVAGFIQALAERRNEIGGGLGRTGSEEPDHRHRRLLRARCKRPCDSRPR